MTAGGTWIAGTLLGPILQSYRQLRRDLPVTLTERETEVLLSPRQRSNGRAAA